MFGSRSRTTCYRFSFASPDENCSTPAILRETSYRHIPKCNERFARQYRSVYVIFRVLTHMLLLRTLSRSRSLHPNHSRDHCPFHVHIPKHSRVRRLNPICQPNTPRRLKPICQPNTTRRLKPICQPNTEHHDKKARVRANGDKRATWMVFSALV